MSDSGEQDVVTPESSRDTTTVGDGNQTDNSAVTYHVEPTPANLADHDKVSISSGLIAAAANGEATLSGEQEAALRAALTNYSVGEGPPIGMDENPTAEVVLGEGKAAVESQSPNEQDPDSEEAAADSTLPNNQSLNAMEGWVDLVDANGESNDSSEETESTRNRSMIVEGFADEVDKDRDNS